MLQNVEVGQRSLSAYEGVAPDAILTALRDVASDLRGVRVLHINATSYGGGVSELLRSTVPLYNDLGLIADWKIITGDQPFFEVTKKIHNGLQGAEGGLTEEDHLIYEANARANADALTEQYDVIFIHDPQPAAILPLHGNGQAQWVWRCHIDTGQPNQQVWEYCRQFLPEYNAAIFTMDEFVPPDFPVERVDIIPPAIDPLSPKNLDLSANTARQILQWIGVRTSGCRPEGIPPEGLLEEQRRDLGARRAQLEEERIRLGVCVSRQGRACGGGRRFCPSSRKQSKVGNAEGERFDLVLRAVDGRIHTSTYRSENRRQATSA